MLPSPEDPPPGLRALRAIRRRLTVLVLVSVFAVACFARALERVRVPPAASAVGLMAGLGVLVLGAAWWAAGPAGRRAERAPEIGQDVRWKRRGLLECAGAVRKAPKAVGELASGGQDGVGEVGIGQGGLVPDLAGGRAGAGSLGVGTVALVTIDTLGQALRAPLAQDTRTSIEGQIVTPLLLGRHLAINAVAVFVTVMLWVWLWGIAGAFLAVPVLVIVKVLADNLPPLAAFGRFLDAPRPRD